ncbi:MAG TPA: transcriptional repressor [Bacteroidota bacterium]|nr:transcriptional repressor [Bacteroidota bacterium]
MDTSSARDILKKFLLEKKLRPTRERLLLLDEIMKMTGHFDADQVYASLSRKSLKASRATVYNTLDLLVSCGLISKYRFGESHSRYEKAFGRPRHDHMICLECGDIFEFVTTKLEAIQKEVCEEKKFQPHNSTLQIFGICSRCSSRTKR